MRRSPKTPRAGETIFICEPKAASEERACANKILERMARLAYRRPVTDQDVPTLAEFFDQGRAESRSFEGGIQFALERISSIRISFCA